MKYILVVLCLVQASFGVAQQAPEISNEYKKQLVKLFAYTGVEKSFQTGISEILDLYKKQKKQVPRTFWSALETDLQKNAPQVLMDLFAPVYYKYLDLNDLNLLIHFYETPTGRKYADVTPKIISETLLMGQTWAMETQTLVEQRLQEKGYK